MSATTNARLRRVFILLTGVTLLSWWLGTRNGGQAFSPNAVVTVAVLLMAALKVRVIIWEFMELRHGPALIRRAADGALLALTATLFGVYVFGMR